MQLSRPEGEFKKQLLQELAAKAAKLTGVGEREIFDVILQRERLGSTGVGHGHCIPHGKLTSISAIKGVFARLESPVDFEALDDQPVDLVFLLLAPEGAGADHLKAFVAHCPRFCVTGTGDETSRNRLGDRHLRVPQRAADIQRCLCTPMTLVA